MRDLRATRNRDRYGSAVRRGRGRGERSAHCCAITGYKGVRNSHDFRGRVGAKIHIKWLKCWNKNKSTEHIIGSESWRDCASFRLHKCITLYVFQNELFVVTLKKHTWSLEHAAYTIRWEYGSSTSKMVITYAIFTLYIRWIDERPE